jgi:flavin-dependent dehydrogenase
MYDVAIVGGGPAGSTAASLLLKYKPDLKVIVLEREKFPRDHVGESQLPPISRILDEMGCWDKIEAADFPIKIGATYRWGKSPELWDFEFIRSDVFVDEPRPAKFEGQRKWTAFQVDRAIYDNILLQHAESLGCEVRQETKVAKVLRTGDRVDGFQLEDGSVIEARYYLDGSGHAGLLRRTLGIKADSPTTLQNIAIWDYWQNAEWAVEIGVGGTRVQVMSLGYGWIWFIPLGPSRTSIGLIVPADYYKTCGMKFDELYEKAIHEDPHIDALIRNATSEGNLQTTNDWSFLADRHVGENWFLIGESAGFADPILAAGLTLAQMGAREAAYTILELDKGKHSAEWLKSEYETRQIRRISNHIRFADYWYTANSQFADLKEFTSKLAADNGLDMSPEKAWAWLAQGGFIDDDASLGPAGFSINQVKELADFFGDGAETELVKNNNVFKLNLAGANWHDRASYADGSIKKAAAYVRGNKTLPLTSVIETVVGILERNSKAADVIANIQFLAQTHQDEPEYMAKVVVKIPEALEAMIQDGWVDASFDPSVPLPPAPGRNETMRWNRDGAPA